MISDRLPEISIVIPAFNEEKRLPAYLNEVIKFTSKSKKSYEIIVVDDGSSDRTSEVVRKMMNQKGIELITLKANRGKGHAVKRGLFKAKGAVRVFLDADGSVHPDEIEKNFHFLNEGYDVLIGSRALRSADQRLKQKWLRVSMGVVFNYVVKKVLDLPFQDTQCGFKMFKAHVIKPVFARLYLRRFGFDIELLYLIYRCGFRAVEVPVSWEHKAGSKVNLVTDSLKMLINIFQVWNWHYTPINFKDKYLGPGEFEFMYRMEKVHWWFTSRREFLRHIVSKLVPENAKILDAGCGTGANGEMLATLGEVYGVDASSQAVRFSEKRGMKNVTCTTLENIAYGENVFDVVIAADVLEHLVDPSQVIHSLHRNVKPGGVFVVMVPAFKFLWSQHDEALCHYRRYSKDDLVTALEEAGFKIEKVGYLFFLSFFLVAPVRVIRRAFKKKGEWKSDTTTHPPGFLNYLLHRWFVLEHKLSQLVPLPFGTSLYALARKAR